MPFQLSYHINIRNRGTGRTEYKFRYDDYVILLVPFHSLGLPAKFYTASMSSFFYFSSLIRFLYELIKIKFRFQNFTTLKFCANKTSICVPRRLDCRWRNTLGLSNGISLPWFDSKLLHHLCFQHIYFYLGLSLSNFLRRFWPQIWPCILS